MRRRKITPEVITKTLLTFIFGASVGFSSFHLIGLIRSRFVSATDENPYIFPKTLGELKPEFLNSSKKIVKPDGVNIPFLRNYPTIYVIKSEETADTSSEETPPAEEESNTKNLELSNTNTSVENLDSEKPKETATED